MRSLSIGLLFLCVFGTLSAFSKPVPPLREPVTDLAEMLTYEVRTNLNAVLSEVYRSKQIQLAVLIVKDLEDESLEGYSIKVVDQWKLGSAQQDNGVLLLISQKQRKMRIEVGQGLEGTLTDLKAGRIINQMSSFFRDGNFDNGVLFAVDSILKIVGISDKSLDHSLSSSSVKSKTESRPWAIPIFLIIFIFLSMFGRPRRYGSYTTYHGRGGIGGFRGGGGGGGFSGGGGGFSGGGASGGW